MIDGLVADEDTDTVPARRAEMLMDTPAARRRLAEEALTFALELA